MPVVVIAAFAISAATGGNSSTPSSGPLPAISVSAPPNITAETVACTKVLEKLPLRVDGENPRIVHPRPETPFVVAWGNPAIVFRCGVARPKALHAGSGAEFILAGPSEAGPYYDVTHDGSSNVFTTVDRAAYISVTVPSKYQGGAVMPPLSAAIAKALPAVCTADDKAPVKDLCTRRK